MYDAKTNPRGRRPAAFFLAILLALSLSLAPAWAAEGEKQVIPLGRAVGIKLLSSGVLVVDLSAVTGESFEEIEREFAGKGYGAFKPAVGDAVIETLRPIREEATRLLEDKQYLCSVYTEGAQRASVIARKTLRKVYKKIGLVEKPF